MFKLFFFLPCEPSSGQTGQYPELENLGLGQKPKIHGENQCSTSHWTKTLLIITPQLLPLFLYCFRVCEKHLAAGLERTIQIYMPHKYLTSVK